MVALHPMPRSPWIVQTLLWTLLVGALMLYTAHTSWRKTLDHAAIQAEVSVQKDLVYHGWAAGPGGGYAPDTEATPPNPHLQVPERESTTPSGRQLTPINPAYMIRQDNELAKPEFGMQVHLISLKPIRPENRPDAWEAGALQRLENSSAGKEVELVQVESQPWLRAIFPLIVQQQCLACHQQQGDKLGDIRGGLSVAVPMTPYLSSYRDSRRANLTALAALWLSGLLCQFWAFGILRRQFISLDQAHKETVFSEIRYRDLFNEADYGIAIVDRQTENILECNQKLADILGTEVENLLGQAVSVLPGTEGLTTDIHSREVEISQDPQKPCILEIKKQSIQIEGRIAEQIVFHDRTLERLGEREQLASAQRIQDIFNAAQNVSFVIAANTAEAPILEFSAGAEKIFGYRKEEVLGKSVRILHAPETSVPTLQEKMRQGKIAFSGRTSLVRKSGTVFPALFTLYPLFDEGGNLYGGLGVSIDLSELSELEERLHQAQKMEAIGTLAGGIAHDFNNILSIIFGYTQLAGRQLDKDSKAQRHLKTIEEAAARAKDLVNQILLFSRKSAAGKYPLLVQPVVKEAIKLLRASLPATIEIRELIAAEDVRILADPVQLHQLLMNLCTNAFQAMRQQGGTLTVVLKPVEVDIRLAKTDPALQPGSYLLLQVSDTGAGIPAENLARIFDPFFTTRKDQAGTGLGLAVVHGIVRDQGGAILVDSSAARGTTFSVYLPRTNQPPAEAPGAEKSSAAGSERILLVDDEPMLAALGHDLLKALGYSVKACTSSAKALGIFKENPAAFDLVISDQTMPHLSGDELTVELLKIRPDLPVILCTGYSEIVNRANFQRCGAKKLLNKPLEKDQLGRAIRAVLDGE